MSSENGPRQLPPEEQRRLLDIALRGLEDAANQLTQMEELSSDRGLLGAVVSKVMSSSSGKRARLAPEDVVGTLDHQLRGWIARLSSMSVEDKALVKAPLSSLVSRLEGWQEGSYRSGGHQLDHLRVFAEAVKAL